MSMCFVNDGNSPIAEQIEKEHRIQKCANKIRSVYKHKLSEEQIQSIALKMYEQTLEAERREQTNFLLYDIPLIIVEEKEKRNEK